MGGFLGCHKNYNLGIIAGLSKIWGKGAMKDSTVTSLKIAGFILMLLCIALLKNSDEIAKFTNIH